MKMFTRSVEVKGDVPGRIVATREGSRIVEYRSDGSARGVRRRADRRAEPVEVAPSKKSWVVFLSKIEPLA